MSSILIKIKSKYPQMNDAMKRIADYVLNNPNDVVFEKASTFAEKSNVSPASVSRFVKLVGYKSFNDFQLSFVAAQSRAEINDEDSLAYNGMKVGETTQEICQVIFSRSERVLNETLGILDTETMESIAKYIDKAKRIVAIGVGRSKITTQALVSRLYRIGYNIVEYSDSHEIVNITSIMQPGDLLIACSNFGKSKSVVEGARRAKENGVTVVGITSVVDSPLANSADYLLLSAYDYASDKMGKLFEPSSENVAQLVLVDCLYMLVATKHEKENLNRYKRFSNEIVKEHVK